MSAKARYVGAGVHGRTSGESPQCSQRKQPWNLTMSDAYLEMWNGGHTRQWRWVIAPVGVSYYRGSNSHLCAGHGCKNLGEAKRRAMDAAEAMGWQIVDVMCGPRRWWRSNRGT